eukprot:m.115465 g.115465  ORF g.115465 m.115465 type:complete len:633 (-) comp12841_c1_seq1:1152-3050(-)
MSFTSPPFSLFVSSISSIDAVSWFVTTVVVWFVFWPLWKLARKNRTIVKKTSRLIREGEKTLSVPCEWWTFPFGDQLAFSNDCIAKAGELEMKHPRGSIFQWFGITPTLIFLDPKDIKNFFVKLGRNKMQHQHHLPDSPSIKASPTSIPKQEASLQNQSILSQFPRCMHELVKGSICDVDGPTWSSAHAILSPFFTRPVVIALRPVFELHIQCALDDVRASTVGMEAFKTDLVSLFRGVVAKSVLHALLFNAPAKELEGEDVKIEKEFHDYVNALLELVEFVSNTSLLHIPFLATLSFLPQNKRATVLTKNVRDKAKSLLDAFTSHFLTSSSTTFTKRGRSSVMMELCENLDEEVVLSNMQAILFSAIEPTTALLSWTILLLSCNKEEYGKLTKELQLSKIYLNRDKKKSNENGEGKTKGKAKNGRKSKDKKKREDKKKRDEKKKPEQKNEGDLNPELDEDEVERTLFANNTEDMFIRPKRSFLLAVVNEALRMYPPQPFLSTRNIPDSAQIGDYAMAKGVNVTSSPFLLHRRAGIWSDPSIFWPQRMLDKSVSECMDECFFIPFGTGTRSCLGQLFVYEFVLTVLPSFFRQVALVNPSEFGGDVEPPLFHTTSLLPPNGQLRIPLKFINRT